MAVKKYTINWTDDTLKKPFTVSSNTNDKKNSSLTLIGSGTMEWGQDYQENLLHLLENFASNAKPPMNPTAGQLWFNSAENRLKVYSESNEWVDLKNRRIDSALPPVGKFMPGDLWFDSARGQFKVYLNEGVWSSPMSGSVVTPKPIPVPTPTFTPTPARPITPTPLPPGIITPTPTPSPAAPPAIYQMPPHIVEYYGPEFVWGLDGDSESSIARVAQPVPQILSLKNLQLTVTNRGARNNTITKLLNGTDGVNRDWTYLMTNSTAKVVVIGSFGYHETKDGMTVTQWQNQLTQAAQIAKDKGKLVVFVAMHKVDPALGDMSPFADAMKTVALGTNSGFIDLLGHTNGIFKHKDPTPITGTVLAPRRQPTPISFPEEFAVLPTAANGETIELERGKTYLGTLNLDNKSNITIIARGYGDAPVISSGEEITGFTQYSGNIYRAAISFNPKQVLVDMNPVNPACWPTASIYAQGTGNGSTTITATIPDGNVTGARCVYRTHTWNLESRNVVSGNSSSFQLGNSIDTEIYRGWNIPNGAVSFYLEGKPWMINGPNQWAIEGGYLYVWSLDGNNPDGRVWANGNAAGISARNSTNVKINDVRVVGSHVGIDARGSDDLQVVRSEVQNASKVGIFVTSASDVLIDNCAIKNVKYSGVDGRWDDTNVTIKNCTIQNIGTHLNKPDHIQGGINSPLGTGYSVIDNTVQNAGYIGIRVYRSALVKDNVVDGWCRMMQDGGGIYVNAPSAGIDMNTTIQNNRVRNGSIGPSNYSIYLDDYSRKVNVWDNIVESNNRCTAFILHNAMNNDIRRNKFRMHQQASNNMAICLLDNSDSPFTGNVFTENEIVAPSGIRPLYVVGENKSSAMVTLSNNDWFTQESFANLEGEGFITWDQWRIRFGEVGSTRRAPSEAPAEDLLEDVTPVPNPIHEWLPDGVTPNQKAYNIIGQYIANEYLIEYKKLTSVDTSPNTPKPFGQDSSLYPSLTFQEEFSSGFDANKWKLGNWYEPYNGLENFELGNGSITIWPKQNSNGSWTERNFSMTTDATFYQRYGYFEIEAKLPYGTSVWPSFWLGSHDDSTRPVIKLMETWPSATGFGDNQNRPKNYLASVTAPNASSLGERRLLGSLYNDMTTSPDLSTDFHRYGMRWDSSGITFYFDGQSIGSKISTNALSKRMYLIIDLWLGDKGGPPNSDTPNTKDRGLIVNYIRAWSLNDGTTEVHGPAAIPLPTVPTPTVPTPVAPAPVNAVDVKTTTLVTGIPKPWAIAFISADKVLVTEKPTGILRVVNIATGTKGPAISGLPTILPTSQAKHGGLLDVICDSQFNINRTIYFSYTAGPLSANYLAVSKARLVGESSLEDVVEIFRADPPTDVGDQPGGRICEHTDGTLFISCGDRYKHDVNARQLTNNFGKVVRINKDGSVPANNPYAGSSNAAQRKVWTVGHRNQLGLAIGPDGNVWEHENGAEGGDEINILKPGLDYGWPNQSYGSHYDDGHVPKEIPDTIPGVELPIHWWTPSIAPSGMVFINSDRYGPSWNGNLIVGSLQGTSLRRLVLTSSKTNIASETRYLSSNFGKRIRDVRQGPDGYLYGCTDEDNGQIFRIDPVFPTTPAPSVPTPTTPTPSVQPTGQTGSFTLTFQDEFDSGRLDMSKWNDAIWYEQSHPTINYSVENGSLLIWPASPFVNRTIDTDRKHEQLYGFFEIEAKLPYGRGPWPAFWLYRHDDAGGNKGRPEIDIMEAYPGGGPGTGWGDSNLRPTNFGLTIHKANTNYSWHEVPYAKKISDFGITTDLSARFHKYGMMWESTGITFYFDGQQLGPKWIDADRYFDRPMYIILDLWFGSASGTPDSSTPQGKSNAFEIRYVRAWTFGSGSTPGPVTPTPTLAPTPTQSGGFSATVTQAPSNGSSISGNVSLRIEGSGIVNAELLPAGGYTPRYGTFTVGGGGTFATLNFNTSSLSDGAYDMRIVVWDVQAGGSGSEIVAMPTRRWNVANGTVVTPTVPSSSVIVDYYGDSTIWGLNGASGGRVNQPAPAVFAATTGYQTRNEGVNSTNSTQLINGSDGVHPAWTTQMANSNATWVIINHAINEWQLSQTQYKNNLQQLATVARNAGKKVVFETPNPTYQILSGGNGTSDQDVANKAQWMREIGFSINVPVIDQHKMLTDYANANGMTIQSLIPDGLHPNQSTYTMKGQFAASEFQRILNSSANTVTPTPVAPSAAAPSVASARGYTRRTFFDDFNSASTIGTSGTLWYRQRPFGWPNVPQNALSVSNSILRYTNGDGYSNYGISTVGPGGVGFVQRNGGYFEARIRIQGRGRPGAWTAFWTMSVEHLYGNAHSSPAGYIEVDFLEDLAGAFGWPSNTIAQVVHNWVGSNTTATSGHQIPLTNFNFGDWHTYGTLWVPAASNGGNGYIAFYIDGRETARTTYGTSGNYSIGDSHGWPLILGTGPGANFECDWVAVWGRP